MIIKYLKTALLVSSVALFTACGGGGSSDSTTPPIDYSGDYHMIATSTTENDNSGNPCLGAEGKINVTNSIVTGTVTTGYGDTLAVNGEVTSSGQISGSMTVGDVTAASYEGQMEFSSGTGTWNDISGCSGTWVAAKVVETKVL